MRPGARWRWLGHPGFHLFALSGVAIAQPLLDVLGRHPEDLVSGEVGAPERWAIASVVVLAIPAALAGLAESGRSIPIPRFARPRIPHDRGLDEVAPARRSTTLSDALHLVFVALLGSLLASIWLTRLLPLPAIQHLVAATVLGTASAVLYARRPVVRQFLSWLAPLVVAIPVHFLFFSPASDLSPPPRLAAPGGDGDGPEVAGPSTPVVVILFDELPVTSLMNRRREIDPVLYPRFAELARTSTWYRNANTPASLTWRSVPALVTGRYPRDGQHPTLEHHPRNLFTWLLDLGYELAVTEPTTHVCPPQHLLRLGESRPAALRILTAVAVLYLHVVLPPSFDARLPDLDTAWVPELGNPVEQFRLFVDQIRPREGPPLVFLHILLPHHPWRYLPSGRAYHVADDEIGVDGLEPAMNVASVRWTDDDWAVTQAYQRHLLQVQLTDRLLGELLDRLRSLDLFDRSLLVVAADHGVSFRAGGRMRQPDSESYGGIAAVPLFVKLPHQATGGIDDRDIELVDVLPTIADVLGRHPEWPVEGRSALAPALREPRRKLIYHTPDEKLWIDDPLIEKKYLDLARKLRLFPDGGDPLAHFRVGPRHQELLGRTLDDLEMRGGGRLSAAIDFRDRYDRLDPTADLIPSRVTGYLESAEDRQTLLALSVNGVIEAVSLTRVGDGNRYFTFMVPETAWRPGHNELALLAVLPATSGSGPADDLALEPVSLPSPVTYTLVLDDRGTPTKVESSDGQTFRVDSTRFSGQAADIVYEGRTYQVIYLGWAMNGADGRPADRILLFDDQRLLNAGRLNFDRSTSRARYKMPGREKLGFHYVVPRQDIRGTVSIFGLFADGTARPLVYTQQLEPQPIPSVRHQGTAQE